MRKSIGTATGTSKKRTGSNIDTSTDSTRICQAYKIHPIHTTLRRNGGEGVAEDATARHIRAEQGFGEDQGGDDAVPAGMQM